MRISVMLEGQEGVTWSHWLAVAQACERLGFEGLFTSDHYFSAAGVAGRGSNDAWTILSGLAARTERIRLGTLVSPVTFRHPSVLAKAATTVDHVSGGRVDLGIGAGWWEREHRAYGFPFPPDRERMEMLEEQLEVVHRLLSRERVTFRGRHYTLEDCEFLFEPVQRPHPPIVVGGSGGPRIARLVARWADEFNTVRGTPSVVRERFARVREAVDAAGRDQSTVTTSVMTWMYLGADEDELRSRIERVTDDADGRSYEDHVADLSTEHIVGTPERAAERISEYAAAGAQRIVLNHELFDDVSMLELLAHEVLPRIEG